MKGLKNRRFGRIYVSKAINIDKVIDALYEIRFFPMKVEYLYFMDMFEMIGYSTKFDIVSHGEDIPTYDLIIHTDPKSKKLLNVEVERR